MRFLTSLAASAALALSAGSALPTQAAPAAGPESGPTAQRAGWLDVGTGDGEQYRALDAINARVAWVAGEEGGIWRSVDGGRTWGDVSPPRFDGFAFRDIEAQGPRVASVLAIGPGRDSRIFRTLDGGGTWSRTFLNREPTAFFNCMDFWGGGRAGIAVSDPVDGKFRILRTRDRGASWSVVPPRGMPAAVDGEFNFAASGTCLVVKGDRRAYMASGGAASRVFRSSDRGRTWRVTDAPIPAAEAGGVFSMAFRTLGAGVLVGGDFTEPEGRARTGITRSGGRSFVAGGRTHGYRSGVAYWANAWGVVIAVGPSGSDVSRDGGRTWRTFSRAAYDGVDCTASGACWASGPDGGVARLTWR